MLRQLGMSASGILIGVLIYSTFATSVAFGVMTLIAVVLSFAAGFLVGDSPSA